MKPVAVLKLVWNAAKDFDADDALTQGAALAFYTALSLGPLVVVSIFTAEALGGGVREAFFAQVRGLVGPVASDALTQIVEGADASLETRRLPGIVAFSIALFSAAAVFANLQHSLNKVWDVEAKPGWNLAAWVRKRLLSFAMLAGIGFLLLVSLVVSTGLAMLFTQKAWTWQVVEFATSIAVFTALFMLIFCILPDVKITLRETWVGAFITACLFAAGKFAIGTYLAMSSMGRDYGAAGSLVVLLAWVYWSSLIVLFGAEVTQAHVTHRRKVKAEGPAKKLPG